jgi:hypothetical protein
MGGSWPGSDGSMTRSGKLSLAIAITLTVSLLLAHILQWTRLKVDNVTLVLLGILLVLPFFESIKKIRLGEFEAEIAPREVTAIVAKASSDLPSASAAGETRTEKSSPLLELVRQDPQLGLAKLRIDIEQALRALHTIGKHTEKPVRIPPLSRMVNELERSGEMSRDIALALKEVLSVANRAAHGEFVTFESAEKLSVLGSRLLDELWAIYRNRVSEPLKSIRIQDSYLDLLSAAQYRVISAIPLTKNPEMNVRILNQAGLNEFLDGYEEYGEFLVSIEPIDVQIPTSLHLPPPAKPEKK